MPYTFFLDITSLAGLDEKVMNLILMKCNDRTSLNSLRLRKMLVMT